VARLYSLDRAPTVSQSIHSLVSSRRGTRRPRTRRQAFVCSRHAPTDSPKTKVENDLGRERAANWAWPRTCGKMNLSATVQKSNEPAKTAHKSSKLQCAGLGGPQAHYSVQKQYTGRGACEGLQIVPRLIIAAPGSVSPSLAQGP